MNPRKIASLFFLFVALFVATPATVGCSGHPEATTDQGAEVAGVDFDPAPPRESVFYAMDAYENDPASARAHDPVSIQRFFDVPVDSTNWARLRVELLRPNPRYSDLPVAFLHADFAGGDMYWNDRYKDMTLYWLADSTGTNMNPFPEADYVQNEGSALVRIWAGYRPVSMGAPSDLQGDALLGEVARIAVWAYVAGNVDGPAVKTSNGGFAPFQDESGRTFWRGVLIDNGAAWNTPDDRSKPWNTNILDTGPVQGNEIPMDVSNGLIQIANAAPDDLAAQAHFTNVDDGARRIVGGIQVRAREVLDYYGIAWQ